MKRIGLFLASALAAVPAFFFQTPSTQRVPHPGTGEQVAETVLVRGEKPGDRVDPPVQQAQKYITDTGGGMDLPSVRYWSKPPGGIPYPDRRRRTPARTAVRRTA